MNLAATAMTITTLLVTCASAPDHSRATAGAQPSGNAPANTLSAKEKAEGWRLLFDGTTTNGWRGFRRKDMPDGWKAVDGALTRVDRAGDIVTSGEFADFELALEWSIAPGGNSGVFYRVTEDDEVMWHTAPEIQIIDNAYRESLKPVQTAGADYDLHAPSRDMAKPAGSWNQMRVLVKGSHVEHWLNGVKIVDYELWSDDWEKRVQASKFKEYPRFGRARKGHIGIQDHGDRVAFRNIKIRELAAAQPRLDSPTGLALDGLGNLYISDIATHQVLKRTPKGGLTVAAGTGAGGFSGDGGPAPQARLFAPHGLALDVQGRLLIADTLNHRIRRIERDGAITTVAGIGTAGYTGDGGRATAASLNGPQDIAVDRHGNMFVADSYNAVVRRIDSSGIITTVAGSEPGLRGDGGPATAAQLNLPTAVASAADGVVYVSDAANSRIRRIAPDGSIQTLVGYGGGSGLGGAGYAGDGGAAEKAKVFSAMGVQSDGFGNLYISDSGNHRVRVVRRGVISTVAGSGASGFGGDGGTATAATLNTPQKIALAPDGRLFIADRGNARVRMVDPAGVIRTIVGQGKPGRVTARTVKR